MPKKPHPSPRRPEPRGPSPRPDARPKPPPPARDGEGGRRGLPPPDVVYLWGVHAVVEALGSPRRKPLRVTATAATAPRVADAAARRNVPLVIATGEEIGAKLPGGAVHQGLLLEARRLEPIAIDDVRDDGVVLLLDQITDPHNVGAILRSAAAFGATAVVMTDRHAPHLSGTLAKAASGGLEHVPVAVVVNLARALDRLGERGFLRVGLDSAGERSLEQLDLPRPLALVLGAEDAGLRRLTRERCDLVARLDMPGPIKSLNVSNACAVALAVAKLRGAQ